METHEMRYPGLGRTVLGSALLMLLGAGCANDVTTPRTLSSPGFDRAVSGPVGSVVYDNIPKPLPPNVPSQGFQCCQTAEFGDYVRLAGTARRPLSATVLMSDWAKHSEYPLLDNTGFTHPITLNLYAVDNSSGTPALGALLGTVTQSFLIPWRPEADPSCSGGTAWKANDGKCYNGFAFTIKFDLTSLALTLPDNVIFGVAYNTNTWGYHPIGASGPYESLNVGLAGNSPYVGTDVEPDAVFWNTLYAPNYTDLGAGGVGKFRRDTGWTGSSPAVSITTVFPTPTNANSCKDGGWQSLGRADYNTFKNQGDCVQYVNTNK
jgi:hypothetical protein